jgi:hypothetical protein
MSVGRFAMRILTTPEPCESGCGSRVAVTEQEANPGTSRRLSHINDDGSVAPGPHSPAECRGRRGL